MLPLAVVKEIRRLLEEGHFSHRKIAAKLGVSRGTVGAVASGRRGMYGREPVQDAFMLSCQDFPPERCPGCGATVYKPCVLCNTRAYQQRKKQLADFAALMSGSYGRRVA